ncbi:dihydrodipicolinate synthase family protein [Bacillus sp. J14TS2]|uniref:4-hydroxy-tetrahydrodipicolinate synthase n=1 Tax=Bacillus sp. J14TS2 TaxID=2807188 RepID=UPI001B15B147|nr:4-hydroxy-tetrahydrodipicolinate synthase [Bacillus sp. J14TS2]GIN71483.1 dihydrodipicolinate synthase family protein [Bacillus sp. J14TS2]
MKKLEGVFPVLITPMEQNGEINWSGLKENIEHFIQNQVAGIVVNGSTGEFVSLTKEERFRVAEIAAEQVNGRIPLIVGTAAETTSDAVIYTRQAESVGADAALLINSYYAHPKENELYEHFKTIASSVVFPVMIYNNPYTSGVNMSTDLILKVGRGIENITHIKESSGDIRKVRDLTRQGSSYIQTFCGADDLALESFLVGATGWISVAGNIAPRLVTDLFVMVQKKQLEVAWKIYDSLLPLCRFLEESGKYVQIVKRAMELQGLAGGPSRKPRLPLSTEEDAKLQSILESLGVFENEKEWI